MARLPDGVRELLEAPNFAHLATVRPDGSPDSVPIWVRLEGDRIAFFTQPSSRKARNLGRDPRVALSLVDLGNPYRSAWIRRRIAETIEGEPALEVIDRLSNRYTGEPFPMRSGVVFLVAPERAGFVELPFSRTPPGDSGERSGDSGARATGPRPS
jgi:PPOX class probable F420-dependent enzyme